MKSVKHPLRRMISDHKFTYKEFYTLLTCIDTNLNSRLIDPFANYARGFCLFYSRSFLIDATISSVPKPSLEFFVSVKNFSNVLETLVR